MLPAEPQATQGTQGPLLVMLHWLGGGAHTWRAVGHSLASRGIRFIALDLPGFGQAADQPATDVSNAANAVADSIRDLRQGAETIPWILGGHSMGGKIAAVLARRALDGEPGLEGLRGLILTSPSPPSPEPIEDARRAEHLKNFGDDHADPAARHAAAAKWITGNSGQPPLPDATRDEAIAGVLRNPPTSYRAWFLQGSKEDWSARVGTLPLPALLFTGSAETSLGEPAQRKLTLPHLPHATLISLENAKHLGPLERPQAMIEHITEFLTSLDLLLLTSPQSPGEPFQQLLQSAHTSPATRNAMTSRLEKAQTWNYLPQTFTAASFRTLRALAECLIPGAGFDLAATLDSQLAANKGDGWRYADLPADPEAWQRGLDSLDAAARSRHNLSFLDLYPHLQRALLDQAAQGQLDPGQPNAFTPAQLKLWFEDVRGDLTRLYVGDPRTMDRIGYTGFADDLGFTQIQLGQQETFER